MAAKHPTPRSHTFKDRAGQTVGKWSVIEFRGTNPKNCALWLCRCECGTEKVMASDSLKKAKQCRRCGQLQHGLSHTPECRAWHHMRGRCENPDHPSYHRYGGRGITVCEEWQSFEAFYRDMGPRPSPKHTLERKKNDEGYCKSNCTWATRKEQSHNTVRTRLITHAGVTKCLREWARTLGTHHRTLSNRIKSLGVEAAFAFFQTQ